MTHLNVDATYNGNGQGWRCEACGLVVDSLDNLTRHMGRKR